MDGKDSLLLPGGSGFMTAEDAVQDARLDPGNNGTSHQKQKDHHKQKNLGRSIQKESQREQNGAYHAQRLGEMGCRKQQRIAETGPDRVLVPRLKRDTTTKHHQENHSGGRL